MTDITRRIEHILASPTLFDGPIRKLLLECKQEIERLQVKEGYVVVNVKHIMGIKEALVQEDYQEAYHQLYQIANDQAADKYHPWAEFEAWRISFQDSEQAARLAYELSVSRWQEWQKAEERLADANRIIAGQSVLHDEIVHNLQARVKELETQIRDRSELGLTRR
jgi:hypothetical protein